MSRQSDARRELLDEFRSGTRERVEAITHAWLKLERDISDAETASDVMRQLHSLKGESKMMGYDELSRAAHRTESLIIALSQGKIQIDDAVGDLMLAAADSLLLLLEASPGSDEASRGVGDLVARIDVLLGDGHEDGTAPSASSPAVATRDNQHKNDQVLRVNVEQFAALADLASESVIAHESFQREARRVQERLQHASELVGEAARSAEAMNALRVLLTDLEGEALNHYYSIYDGGLQVRELEHMARQLRLVPIRNLLQKHVRAARELARELGKAVTLDVDDRDTVVDKSVADRLAEPLLHIVRNCVDHGVETPQEREQKGKPREGSIHVNAVQDGRWVVVRIVDDGGGIDRNVVKRRAIAKGVISEREAAALTDDETVALLFHAGFSTRDVVSETSGRGVGLDVVKRQVEGIGGHVRMTSEVGLGTRVELRVPATVALSRVLVVELDDELYALPGGAVEAVLEVDATTIMVVRDSSVIRFRDRNVPLIPLGPVFGLHGAITRRAVIIRDEDKLVALGVPGWRGDVEVVVKPVGSFLTTTRLVTGACVLGEKEVAPMLNPVELVGRALGTAVGNIITTPTPTTDTTKHILLVEDSSITRTMIARILRAFGYDICEAPDGEVALSLLSRRAVDLVLTDIDMPRMDGITLVQNIRAKKDWQRLPIVVLSTRGSAEDQRRALDAGADGYLVKTEFSEEALRELISTKIG